LRDPPLLPSPQPPVLEGVVCYAHVPTVTLNNVDILSFLQPDLLAMVVSTIIDIATWIYPVAILISLSN
jgi:hypothetical protein